MITKLVRFPNTDFFQEILMDISKFKPQNEFQDEIFGWYGNILISIKK